MRPPEIGIHYLGHAAFVLRFGTTTVVTDLGKPNAWKEWGWDSPIHDLGALVPDAATYSHIDHEDHYDPTRLPAGVGTIVLPGSGPVELGALRISPIPLHESDLGKPSSTAYRFDFLGATALHLGDCQADIAHVEDETIRNRLAATLPRRCDLALIPLESQQQFFPQLMAFLALLKPGQVIPMHFWSEDSVQTFLEMAQARETFGGRRTRLVEPGGAQCALTVGRAQAEMTLFRLHRASFRGWSS